MVAVYSPLSRRPSLLSWQRMWCLFLLHFFVFRVLLTCWVPPVFSDLIWLPSRQVSRLGDEVREKENTILRHRLGPDWTPALEQNIKVYIMYT